jgi:GNAT superfamily N-acetyltransferase
MLSPFNLVEVTNKKLLKAYIHFPYRLYKNYPNYVPPLLSDEWDFHNPEKNLSLKEDETIKALLFENGKIVGRIMGIIPKRFNADLKIKHCRFFHFDCEDRIEVAEKLIGFIETWGRQKGMHQLTGPFGFSEKDPQGLQIEGFEHLPVVAAPCNPPYLPALLEKLGFEKEADCVSYSVPVPDTIPQIYHTIAERTLRNKNLHVARIRTRWELKKYIYPVLELVNESFRHIYGFNIMSHQEMKNLAFKFLLFLDPRFATIVMNAENKPVGFIVGIPDISKGLQRACGSLFPFGIFHIMRAAKKSKQLDMLLGAVHPDYQSQGITAVIAVHFLAAAKKYGMKTMDSHLNLETNVMMNREMQRAGGHIYKRFRIFKRMITPSPES